jgi:hypothetical protein
MGVRIEFGFDLSEKLLMLVLALCSLDLLEQLVHFSMVFLQQFERVHVISSNQIGNRLICMARGRTLTEASRRQSGDR